MTFLQATSVSYEERRSAINRSVATWLWAIPLAVTALTCVMLGITVNGLLIGLAGALYPTYFIFVTRYLYRNWPTGIRVDTTGITIGAIQSSRARIGKRRPRATLATWGLYSCPWEAIRDARVVTDRDELKMLKRRFRYTFTSAAGGVYRMEFCDIGVFTAPFTRAALVLNLDPSEVMGTTVRPSWVNVPLFPYKVRPRMSDTWIVPTRHPEALQEALKRYQQ